MHKCPYCHYKFEDKESLDKHVNDGCPTLRLWVAKSCVAQGVPIKVTDPLTIRKIAVLLGK